MKSDVRRIFVEKKEGFNIEAHGLYNDLKNNLGIQGLKAVRIINRYDVAGLSDEEYGKSKNTIFSEPPVDYVYEEKLEVNDHTKLIAVEYLPGQYDQRADSACQCIQILTCGEKPEIRVARIIALEGDISDEDYRSVKEYCINPVECREASLDKPKTLGTEAVVPDDVEVLHGFNKKTHEQLAGFVKEKGLAMSLEDLEFCRQYFRDTEKRDPSMTEIRVIDTYWSDHCRHTTFLTSIDSVKIEEGKYSAAISEAYQSYLKSRKYVYADKNKDMCLMDLAVIAMKELRKRGMLEDLDASDEINACSIVVDADINGKNEEWLVMFKNETHNHPTEIEPFGGAATCLGGAIRDPLSGRSYVYQAMRVTGSGDPRTRIEDTLQGKLPQKKITTVAAAGYSSYGNQIGLATGQVSEVYDPGYVAKRMEIGAVIGAAPKRNVVRETPLVGDVVILLGGRTGRDGCGGATGSSKEHNEDSLVTCGAEVQKGNPPTERKIQRLFRNPEVSSLIKRCNDFGAGGVSVAIGELADGLDIDLDLVPKKYEGLDGTELAISESQERMAVVVSPEAAEKFINAARVENLEATMVARVTETRRLRMLWRGKNIVDISRDFLDTNGVNQHSDVRVAAPADESCFEKLPVELEGCGNDIKAAWLANLSRLNVCSQKGLSERFDSTIGAGSVLMPFGGRYQLSPSEGMAAKLPVQGGDTSTGTLMAYGYNPVIARWSPFHGALYAVVEAVTKIAVMGGNIEKVRLTLQEYFEKLGSEPERWGKPFSALLGAYYAQLKLGLPAIGGKDSMSGTFKDMDVPPTLVAFAVGIVDVNKVISADFKKCGSKVVLIPMKYDERHLPDFDVIKRNCAALHKAIGDGAVISASTVKAGGIAEAISKMCFGSMIGFEFSQNLPEEQLFTLANGAVVAELDASFDCQEVFSGIDYKIIGTTTAKQDIKINSTAVELAEALEAWEKPLEKVFPTRTADQHQKPVTYSSSAAPAVRAGGSIVKPRIFMPVFPGTNCEYDTARAFEKAGGAVDTMIVRNLTSHEIEQTMDEMANRIGKAQIVMLPGGFSGGDEPDGSGKFIATAFRNPFVKEAVTKLLKERDGLMLGICNGFQALIKLGLVPYGEIRDMEDNSATLTFNTIGRHVSCMVYTRVASTLSPWFSNVKVGDLHTIAVSHGEGRFVADSGMISSLASKGQIATQYVDIEGNATYDIRFNPNGSLHAIEGITSPDGRVLGKMGHSERIGSNVAVNVPGQKDQKIFEAGVNYFK